MTIQAPSVMRPNAISWMSSDWKEFLGDLLEMVLQSFQFVYIDPHQLFGFTADGADNNTYYLGMA